MRQIIILKTGRQSKVQVRTPGMSLPQQLFLTPLSFEMKTFSVNFIAFLIHYRVEFLILIIIYSLQSKSLNPNIFSKSCCPEHYLQFSDDA